MPGPVQRLALALAVLAVLGLAGPAVPLARAGDGGEREQARVAAVCGERSGGELRVRVDDRRLRVELQVRTATRGVWRVLVLHERRIVRRARVRATAARRGFRYRTELVAYAGPNQVRVRAVSPRGESCAAVATVDGS